MNILEIGVVLFLAWCLWHGYHKGLIRVVFSMVALLVTIGIAVAVSPYVNSVIKGHTGISGTIQKGTAEFVHETVGEWMEEEIESQADKAWIIDKLPLPKSVRSMLVQNDNKNQYELLGISTFETYLSAALTEVVLSAISFLFTFLVARLCVQILIFALDLVSRIPGIHGLNHMAGLCVGFLQGIVILWVLCLAVTAFAGMSWGQNIMQMIQKSQLLSFIYNNNLLVQFITNLI